jgi:NAD-dependent dihydropyrimidine dehydrogenase PreA subunit
MDFFHSWRINGVYQLNKKTIFTFLMIIGAVIGLSILANNLWQQDSESSETGILPEINISEQMTIRQIADAYKLSPKALKGPLGLESPLDINKTVKELGLSITDIKTKLRSIRVLASEESSKNWLKIPLKFLLWITFLVIVYRLMRKGSITPSVRRMLLLTAVGIFGVIFGADPSPMGTVKDAIVLWGKEHVIFPPRLIALSVFLLTVVLANKFICSWGCQLGALQDLLFRTNRNLTDTAALTKQWKIPFTITNTVRIALFAAICMAAIAWAIDIVSPIDPFTIFKPAKFSAIGAVFTGLLLLASLYIYRPWCHMFCPFGLLGWIAEKISIYKIKVNYDSCIACKKCARACPSSVMEAILEQDRVIPDCFSCGTCQHVCPTKSITFDKGYRSKPPAGKFKKES